MIYNFFGSFVPRALKIYVKRVFISGEKQLYQKKPALFACNHPNSFFDAVVIAGLFYKLSIRSPWFLARGDAFKTAFSNWFLRGMKILPIFRRFDEGASIDKNQATYKECYQLLDKKEIVGFFSEGVCVVEKRLRKLKKGTARMAFGAETRNNWQLGLVIYPVGVNYTYPFDFRTEYILDIGEPIEVSKYRKLYEENEAKAINQLTKDIEKILPNHVIIINEKEDEELAEYLLIIQRNNHYKPRIFKPWLNHSRERFLLEKRTCDAVNNLSEEKKSTLKQVSSDYFNALSELNIRDHEVARRRNSFPALHLLAVIACYPLHLLGKVVHHPAASFANKKALKIKQNQFHVSVKFLMALVLYIAQYLLILIIAYSINWQIASMLFALLLLSAYAHLYVTTEWPFVQQRIRFLRLSKELKNQLALKRQKIIELFAK